MEGETSSPRVPHPATPGSPQASSLYRATSTIDDLTLALTNYSRVPSPEPEQVCCCCGKEDCEATRSWLAVKAKLENRLILSAEVGSALLQRHEAYIRRHEAEHTPRTQSPIPTLDAMPETPDNDNDTRVAELMKENAVLHKRLTQALLNNEISDASTKSTLQDLEEARGAVSRLTAQNARAVGLDSRLTALFRENEDVRQERDSEAQRAKLAEARLAALKDRTDKLQAEVKRLQNDLNSRRLHRLESSESLLQHARSRIEELHQQRISKVALPDNAEVMQVLESLVGDNELLKADNEELQQLLSEAREDVAQLQSEVEEYRASMPIPTRAETPHSRRARSGPSSLVKESVLTQSRRRTNSADLRTRRHFEPLTPETESRPISPDPISEDPNHSTLTPPQITYPPSQISQDLDQENDGSSLFQNHRSRGVQTDQWTGPPSSANLVSFYPDQISASSHEGRSESSSLLDGQGSQLAGLLERVAHLLQRLSQADALTLKNRLKRQNLKGADVKHLSRTTVANILSEMAILRSQYRIWLEDDKLTLTCNRRDLRGLFKIFKDAFDELGQLRVTLNDVILEPSIAEKVSEMALDPAKAEAMERERKSGRGSSWMTPFSKLFGSVQANQNTPSTSQIAPKRPTSRGQPGDGRQLRPALKMAPALAATTTTVNVEFSGAGVGKSTTSTSQIDSPAVVPAPSLPSRMSTMPPSQSIMGIFAGAPKGEDDPWVVLPRGPRRAVSAVVPSEATESSTSTAAATATIGRASLRRRPGLGLSRGLDAVLDNESILNMERGESPAAEHREEDDLPGPLPQRALRRKGLSDSSIHSTFMSQAEESQPQETVDDLPGRGSVFRTLSRTMQSFRLAASQSIGNMSVATAEVPPSTGSAAPPPSAISPFSESPPPPAPSPPHSAGATGSTTAAERGRKDGLNVPRTGPAPVATRTSSPIANLVPNLTSWAAAGAALESESSAPMYFGTFRDEAMLHRRMDRDGQDDHGI